MVSTWQPQAESWYSTMTFENSSAISEALSSCYALLEGAWSSRSENYKLLSETKLRHSLSSCKSFINLAINKELSSCENSGAYWYSVNMISSATSTVLFIVMTVLIARLRRSNKVKSRMKRYLPERWFDLKNKKKSWFHRATPVQSSPGPTYPTTSTTSPCSHYIPQSPYKSSGAYPTIHGVTQLGSISSIQSQSGAPASPYPVQTPHGPTIIPSSPFPVPASRHHVEIASPPGLRVTTRHPDDVQRQSEVSDSGQIVQGAEIDRQLTIAERNVVERNVGNRDIQY